MSNRMPLIDSRRQETWIETLSVATVDQRGHEAGVRKEDADDKGEMGEDVATPRGELMLICATEPC